MEEATENEEKKESHQRQSDQALKALCQEGNTQIQGGTFAKCIFPSETVDRLPNLADRTQGC